MYKQQQLGEGSSTKISGWNMEFHYLGIVFVPLEKQLFNYIFETNKNVLYS